MLLRPLLFECVFPLGVFASLVNMCNLPLCFIIHHQTEIDLCFVPQVRTHFIPEAVLKKREALANGVEAEKKKLERHILEEEGDDYILDLKSKFCLPKGMLTLVATICGLCCTPGGFLCLLCKVRDMMV